MRRLILVLCLFSCFDHFTIRLVRAALQIRLYTRRALGIEHAVGECLDVRLREPGFRWGFCYGHDLAMWGCLYRGEHEAPEFIPHRAQKTPTRVNTVSSVLFRIFPNKS